MNNGRVHAWTRVAVLVAVATLLVTCSDGPLYGDALYEVQIENGTSAVLVVSEIDVIPSAKPMVTRISPGKTLLSAWRRPRRTQPNERSVVRAENEAGQVVFCRSLTYADVTRLNHRITILAGDIAC